MGSSAGPAHGCDYSFKILLIGDSGVGKSSLLVSFISNNPVDDLSPTIGVDFKIKHLTVGEKKLKLTIWDTAGQERFRALTGSYFRGSQGIILVYDVTKRETFTNLADVWIKEVQIYCTNHNCVKLLIGNKVDQEADRVVTTEEGIAFADEYGCSFLECSAKTRANVDRCFQELSLKILGVPELVAEGSAPVKRNIVKQKQEQRPPKRKLLLMIFSVSGESLNNQVKSYWVIFSCSKVLQVCVNFVVSLIPCIIDVFRLD